MRACILLAMAAWAAGANATDTEQLPFFELDPIVVTAGDGPTPLNRSTASTAVITADEIRASGQTHVAELLREVAGVQLFRGGSRGKATTARIRGGNANQTLVLIDGVQANSTTLGLYDFADLSVDNIERIEVVRGPLSAVHGSEALGGVIQIITKPGSAAPQAWASFEGGSLRTLWGRGGASGQVGSAFAWSLGASHLTSDGQELVGSTGPVEHDAYKGTNVSARMDASFGERYPQSLTASLRWTDGERDLPIEVFGSRVIDVNSTQEDRNLTFAAGWSSAVGRWQPSLRFGYAQGHSDFADPMDPGELDPFAGDYDSQTNTDRQTLTWENSFELHPSSALTAGLEWERRAGVNRDSFSGQNFDADFTTRSFFVSHNWTAPSELVGADNALIVNAGLRVDDTDTYGASTSPKIGGLLSLANGLARIRLGYSEGFRAPSINELAFPFFGNAELEPESSRGFEVGVGTRLGETRGDVELRYFRTRFDELIVPDPASFVATNLDEALVQGLEAEARWLLRAQLYLRASYTYVDTEEIGSGDELLRQPRHRGAISLSYSGERFRLSARTLLNGSFLDVEVEGYDDEVEAWSRVDLSGGLYLGSDRRWELFASVNNLLDSEYDELKGFPAPGVEARIGLRLGL